MSIWNLGEGHGFRGSELELFRLTCPFCEEDGNFELFARAEKKKANSNKVINFDTYECGSCKGYIQVLWSAGDGLYNFYQMPRSRNYTSFPDHWPALVGRYWLQAKRSLNGENWDATVLTARSALQAALRDKGAEGANLYQEIVNLCDKGVLPSLMADWGQSVREIGNDAAHPRPEQEEPTNRDCAEIVKFLDFLFRYLYDLPHDIEVFRGRNE